MYETLAQHKCIESKCLDAPVVVTFTTTQKQQEKTKKL